MLAIPILLVIVCVGLCRWATGRYESMLARATNEQAPTAHTGAEVARLFLAFEGIADVEIVEQAVRRASRPPSASKRRVLAFA